MNDNNQEFDLALDIGIAILSIIFGIIIGTTLIISKQIVGIVFYIPSITSCFILIDAIIKIREIEKKKNNNKLP